MEKEKGFRPALCLFVLAMAAMVLLCHHYLETYVTVERRTFARSETAVNLRGEELRDPEQLAQLGQLKNLDLRDTELTEEQYLALRRQLPDCAILWSVPLGEEKVDSNATGLTLKRLTSEDLRMLGYLDSLETLDARGCRAYDLLLELRHSRPEVELRFDVELGGRVYPGTVRELELENVDAATLEQVLPLLSELERVTLLGKASEDAQVRRWMAEYPEVVFVWQFSVCGVSASSLDTELFLNDILMESLEEVETALGNFYDLKWVELCDCGIPSQELDALWKRHPETRFVWTVQIGRCTLRTDTVSFIPYHFGYDGIRKLWDSQIGELKYCVDMVCLDLGHMGITDYSFLEYMPKLKYLILADTHGTDFSALAGLKELVFLELFLTQFDQAEVLLGLTKLEDLNIGNSRLDHIEPLLEMTWLKRLWLPGTVLVDHGERRQIVNALPDTQVMYACAGSTGRGWRESPNYYAMRDMLNMDYAPGW